MKNLKKAILILAIILFSGCEKEKVCECYYSYYFDLYLPDKETEEAIIEALERSGWDKERYKDNTESMDATCRKNGCN